MEKGITAAGVTASSQGILQIEKEKLFVFFLPEKQFWPPGIQVYKELPINLSNK